MAPRSLICGVTGQDGGYLARLLTDCGHEVHGTSRQRHEGRPANLAHLQVEGVRLHQLDPAEGDATATLLAAVRPDEIYYLAAQSSVARSFDLPVETWRASAMGFVAMLEAARTHCPDARIVNAASGDCFGTTRRDQPATEVSAFAPRSPYAAAKCAAAHAASVARLAHGQFACSAFLFSHESPLRPPTFVVGKIVAAVQRVAAGATETLELGNVEVVRDWGWAPDYVNALRLMASQAEPRDLVVATGTSYRLADLVAALFAAARLDWRDHVKLGAMPPRPADIPIQHADPSAARDMLGWSASTDLDGLAGRLIGG